jgi:hypothetical protein
MPRKPKSIFEIALADTQWRQAHLARELQRKNAAAARSVENNARVIGAGAVRNALGGIAPFVIANDQRQRRGRR